MHLLCKRTHTASVQSLSHPGDVRVAVMGEAPPKKSLKFVEFEGEERSKARFWREGGATARDRRGFSIRPPGEKDGVGGREGVRRHETR